MSRSLHWFWSVLTTVVFKEALSDVSSIDLSKNRMINDKIVIAHRGASGYLPEHTIPAYTFAVAQGADFIEPDIVMTKDEELVILHDIYLQSTTNVNEVFPNRQRRDSNYYAADFTLAEIKKLQVHERIDTASGKTVYEGRFPLDASYFMVPTFREFLEFVMGLEKSTGKLIGIYPEIKAPAFHKTNNLPIVENTLALLDSFGYRKKLDHIFLQCFDKDVLRAIKEEMHSPYPLIQLIGENAWGISSTDYDLLMTAEGVKEISDYAVGIGPWINQITDDKGYATQFFSHIQSSSLLIHPYTARKDDLPNFTKDFDSLLETLFIELDVDGLFTDFPDVTSKFLQNRVKQAHHGT